MHPIFEKYDSYIFDCDGVIFDSNRLKTTAMEAALSDFSKPTIQKCIQHFSENFGKSRYYHIDHFLNKIIFVDKEEHDQLFKKILNTYATQCKSLYLHAPFTEGFLDFLKRLNKPKFVASGSDQCELREVFIKRNIATYFQGIYGSPTAKADNVRNIIKSNNFKDSLMIGDAISDFTASKQNGIDFLFLSGYSLSSKAVIKNTNPTYVVDNFSQILT